MKKLNKKLKRTFFIFCEGETESAYFSVLRQKKNYNVVIKTKVKWQIPTQKDDIGKFYKKIIRETKYTEKLIRNTKSHIYILVDSDTYSKRQMETIKLKKTDISRILRGLSLLDINGEIKKIDYTRLYNKLYNLLKGGLK